VTVSKAESAWEAVRGGAFYELRILGQPHASFELFLARLKGSTTLLLDVPKSPSAEKHDVYGYACLAEGVETPAALFGRVAGELVLALPLSDLEVKLGRSGLPWEIVDAWLIALGRDVAEAGLATMSFVGSEDAVAGLRAEDVVAARPSEPSIICIDRNGGISRCRDRSWS
jgi:hypothetical protein